MTDRTPVEIAAAVEGAPARRLRRRMVSAAEALVGRQGSTRAPHALVWRLRQFITDDPPRIVIHEATGDRHRDSGRTTQILLVSNDLSRSGAPQLVVEIARLLLADGAGVTVVAPADGALRAELTEAGAAVVIDPASRDRDSPLLVALAGGVDAALCNTIDTVAAVETLSASVPLIWYVHEVSLLQQRLAADTGLEAALRRPARLWSGSELSAALLRPARPDVEVVPYGLDPVAGTPRAVAGERPLRLAVLASLEPRKGQDLLLDALALLDAQQRQQIRVVLNGRTLFPDFDAALTTRLEHLPEASLEGPLDAAGYRAALLAADAVVIPSRDDTLPLVSLDALGAGRVLICTRTTGTAAYIDHGVSGFVAAEPTAEAIATALGEAIARGDDWPAIAEAGRAVFGQTFSKTVFARRVTDTLAAIAS